MRDILDQIVKWWDAEEAFGLATVVRTFSSATREPVRRRGLAWRRGDRQRVGRLRRGAVYELATDVIATGRPVLQRYG